MPNTLKAFALCVLPPIAVVIIVLTKYWPGSTTNHQFQGTSLALATVYVIGANGAYLDRHFLKACRRKKRGAYDKTVE